jgi:glycosyltransferase involved in cell wall biosynthesis
MPVYNAERYVARAVESILKQTFEDFEFIIIDDGSTDGTLAIIEAYARRDSRIRIISRSNRGIVATRNQLLSESRCQYCAWLDNDDVAMPRRLSQQVEYMEQHPQCVLLGSRILLIDRDGEPLCEMVDHITHKQIDDHLLKGSVHLYQTSAMMRREAALEVGGYRAGYELAEDVDLYLRLAECGQMVNLPEVLTLHRHHLSSAGHTRPQHQARAALAAINSARLRRGLPPFQENNADAICQVTAADRYRQWSEWALGYGNVSTARKYAIAAVRQQPFSIASWRAMYYSLHACRGFTTHL